MSKHPNSESPFERSTRTRHSPVRQKEDNQTDRIHIQPNPDTPTDNTPPTVTRKATVPKPIQIKKEPVEETTDTEVPRGNIVEQRKANAQTENQETTKQKTTTLYNMISTKEIQQNIASFVPEFSGEENTQGPNNLIRFLGTADSIYNTLTTPGDKKTFAQLIKLRLTGNAYARIANRQIDDYEKLRTIINNMYSKTKTLGELEREFNSIQQSYGETVRNYGHRLIDALENYKTGYTTKYELTEVDQNYSKHLQETAIQAFKRGLNNSILKEKVATIRAGNVDEMINETEVTEQWLIMTGTSTTPALQNEPTTYNQTQTYSNHINRNQQQPNRIICNYCGKPDHTWDVCRTRIYTENRQQKYQQTTQYQYSQNRRPHQQTVQGQLGSYPQEPPDTGKYHQPQRQMIPPKYTTNRYNQQDNTPYYGNRPVRTLQQYNNHKQTPNQNYTMNRPAKYCSYCKTTISHTFEECRNKLRANQNYMQDKTNDHGPQSQPRNENLEERFGNMRINTIAPNHNMQGNSNGSSQP